MFSFIFLGTEITNGILRGLSCFFFAGTLIYKNMHYKINFNRTYFSIIEPILLLSVVLIIPSNIEHKSLIASLLFCLQVFSFEKDLFQKY